MKKGLIFATALAMTLGVGAAVGAHQAKDLKVKAASATLYLDTNHLDWYGNMSYAHLFGTGGNNGWPGQALTQVSGTIYKLDISNTSDYQSVIFLRSDGTNVWNRTSKDGGTAINLPADWSTQNMFTFDSGWNGNVEYDDGNYTGGWSLYTPPATSYSVDVCVDGVKRGTETIPENGLPDEPDGIYGKAFSGWFSDSNCTAGNEVTGVTSNDPIYCQLNSVPTATYTIDDSRVDYSTLNLYAFESNTVHNADWPGEAISNKTITVPNDATIIINDGTHQTVNVTQSGVSDDILRILVSTTDGKNDAAWASADTVPATDGYYITGTMSGWGYRNATKMNAGENGNKAQYLGYLGSQDEEFKVRSYIDGVETWYGWEGDGNYEVGENPRALDIYINGDKNLWVQDHQEPIPDPVYKVHCGFETVTFELDETDKPEGVVHQYSANVPYAYRARVLTFYADDVEITANIGAEAGDETHHNNIVGNVTDGFKIYHTVDSMKVYLKTYNDGGISLWGEGYAENQFFTKIYNESGFQATVFLTLDEDFEQNETYIKQYKTSSEVSIKALAGTAELNSNTFECGALDQDINIENIAGNNAMQAYQTSKWKVHNDCTETIYVKMKADLSLWMYIGGYEDAHVLTIGGQTIQMEKYGDDQYRALGVALHAGDEVTSYTIEGATQTVTAKVVGNNNLGADLKVIADATADIYYSVDNHTLHVSGLPTGGYHILKNGGTVVQMTATEEFDGFIQYKSEMLSFSVGDTLKFIDTDGAEGVRAAVVFAIGKINEGGKGANFEVVKDEHDVVQHIRCTTACSVAVYMKLKSGLDEVYFGQVEEYIEEATNFANAFKAAMATACSATSNKQGAVEAAWATQATNFAGLSEQAQNELKKGGLSSVAEIREFGERYLSIKQHHSDWDLDNFLSWSIPSSGRVASIFDSIVTSNSGIALLVVGIASISFISLAIYAIIRKRKQK